MLLWLCQWLQDNILYMLSLSVFGSVAVVEACSSLPDWFKEKTDTMREYYMAIEFDPKLTREQKYPHMEDWVNKAHDLLVTTHLKKSDFVNSVKRSNLYLRYLDLPPRITNFISIYTVAMRLCSDLWEVFVLGSHMYRSLLTWGEFGFSPCRQ